MRITLPESRGAIVGNSRIIATRKRKVFMAHICSKCGFPVISVVQLEAKAQKTYAFSQSKAMQIAGSTAENAINKEICRIESCWQTKELLIGKLEESSMISPGYFCESSFSGHQTRCPFCLNIEPWKSSSATVPMRALKYEHFPTVFMDAAKAEQWASDYVKSMLNSFSEKATNLAVLEKVKKDAVETHFKFRELLQIMDNLPERSQVEQMKAQLLELRQRKKQLGLLDFKKKSVVTNHINEIELRLEDSKKMLAQKESPLTDQISRIKKRLMVVQAIAFGYKDKVVSSQLNNAFVYLFVPNNIPQAAIDKYGLPGVTDASTVSPSSSPINPEPAEVKSETGMAVYCRKCGCKLLPESLFCSKCGTKVE